MEHLVIKELGIPPVTAKRIRYVLDFTKASFKRMFTEYNIFIGYLATAFNILYNSCFIIAKEEISIKETNAF